MSVTNRINLYFSENFSGVTLSAKKDSEELETKLTNGQSSYKVVVYTSKDLYEDLSGSMVDCLICNTNGNIIDLCALTPKATSSGAYVFYGTIRIPKFLKSGSEIYIGITYWLKTSSGKKKFYKSNSVKIKMDSAIGENLSYSLDPTSDDIVFYGKDSRYSTYLNKIHSIFDQSLSISSVKVDDKNKRDLIVSYIVNNTGKTESVRWTSPGLLELGAITSSGGGKIGKNTKASNGFSGGKNAESGADCVSVGRDTDSNLEGIALGFGAKAYAKASIAIGKQPRIDLDSPYSIYIGQNITDKDKKYGKIRTDETTGRVEICKSQFSILLGNNLFISESPSSIVIGNNRALAKESVDVKSGEKEFQKNYITAFKAKNCVIIGRANRTNYSEKTINIGDVNFARYANNSILIGNNINSIRAKATDAEIKNNVAPEIGSSIGIGRNIILGHSSCIAIGTGATVGVTSKGKAIKTNNTGDSAAAIAIGKGTWAPRPGSIAFGVLAKAAHKGCISIGAGAYAGPSNVQKSTSTNTTQTTLKDSVWDDFTKKPDEDIARSAIAIGYNAKSYAAGAVQIGNGQNSMKNSLKFRNTQIVDTKGNVCANLSSEGITGVLPITKGGIGADNKKSGLANLGVRVQYHTFTFTKEDLKDGVHNKTLPFYHKYSAVPFVFAEVVLLGTNGEEISPSDYNYFISEITNKGVKFKFAFPSQKKNIKVRLQLLILDRGLRLTS